MKTRLFTLSVLTLTLCVAAQAEPTIQSPAPLDYKAPAADLEKWATRIQKLCPSKGWTVSVEVNDVLVQRDKPAKFRYLNGYSRNPRGEKGGIQPSAAYEQNFRLRLSFSPLLNQDKYEQLDAANDATRKQDFELLRKYHLSARKGRLTNLGDDATAAQRRSDYIRESKELVLFQLPDFYSTDYSITAYHSWREMEFLDEDDTEVLRECRNVQNAIKTFFGAYTVSGIEGDYGRPERGTEF